MNARASSNAVESHEPDAKREEPSEGSASFLSSDALSLLYVAVVVSAMVVVKTLLLSYAPISSALSDDFDYMYKSLAFLQGDWGLREYFYKKAHTAPLYSLIISPWVLVNGVPAKFQLVLFINILLSGISVCAGTLAVWSALSKRPFWVPLCLGVFSPLFLFSYFSMTENLLFAFLMLGACIAVKFEAICKSNALCCLLLLFHGLITLIRLPGFALLPATLLLLVLHRNSIGRMRAAFLGVASALASIISYLGFYLMAHASRIDKFTSRLADGFTEQTETSPLAALYFVGVSLINQLGYVMVSTGYWPFVLSVLAAILLLSSRRKYLSAPVRNLFVYCLIPGFIFVLFATLHMSSRFGLDPKHATMFVGRYNDPAGLLVLLLGCVSLVAIPAALSPSSSASGSVLPSRTLRWVLGILLLVVGPVALYFMFHEIALKGWRPMHYIGLSIFSNARWKWYGYKYWWEILAAAFFFGFALSGLVAKLRPLAVGLAILSFLLFQLVTVREGFSYISRISLQTKEAISAAEWIADNTGPDTSVAIDGNRNWVRPVPGFDSWRSRSAMNIYQIILLAVQPRSVDYIYLVEGESEMWSKQLAGYEYFFGVKPKDRSQQWPFEVVWKNDAYILYKLESLPSLAP